MTRGYSKDDATSKKWVLIRSIGLHLTFEINQVWFACFTSLMAHQVREPRYITGTVTVVFLFCTEVCVFFLRIVIPVAPIRYCLPLESLNTRREFGSPLLPKNFGSPDRKRVKDAGRLVSFSLRSRGENASHRHHTRFPAVRFLWCFFLEMNLSFVRVSVSHTSSKLFAGIIKIGRAPALSVVFAPRRRRFAGAAAREL